MMYQTLKEYALKFHASFRSSATILIARLNVLVGCVWTVILTMDPVMLSNIVPQLKDPRYLAAWIMCNGLLTEYGRRRPSSLDALPPSAAGYAPSDGSTK